MLHSFPGYLPYAFKKMALDKGLEGVEVGREKLKFQCAQTQTKSLG